uniref:dTMP kinase n=1 Tax=Dracunculus medinensis TaxID=318479 RepID=A0A0N4U361_DRAME
LMKGRGALIVFEGCDCSGKSSQAKKILEKMFENGFKAEIINFPDRSTDLGKFIDRYLKKEVEMEAREAHLVFSANRHAVFDKMKRKLENGVHLIVDRYAYSGIAYTMAKKTFNMDITWAKLHDSGLLKPDCVIFFDVAFREAEKRDGFGHERFETYEMQNKVYKTMKILQNEEKNLWKVRNFGFTVMF